MSHQHRGFSAVFPWGKSAKYSLNKETDELRTSLIILGKNNSLYRAGKRNKIPGVQFVAYPVTMTELSRLKSILKSSEIF